MNETGNAAHICAEAVPEGPRVYFVRGGKAIKIGFSGDVKKRLAGLQSGYHGTLELLGTIPAGMNTEQAVLTRFKHLRIRGEWFRAKPELLGFIKNPINLPAPEPDTLENATRDFIAWHKHRFKKRLHHSLAHISAATGIAFWLLQLENGVTTDRLEMLWWHINSYNRLTGDNAESVTS